MSADRNRRLGSAVAYALGVGGVLVGTSVAMAAEPTRDELLKQLDELRTKVERLEAGQNAQQERLDAAAVDRTVEEVIRDADLHSRYLQATGFTAGYTGGKFIIQDESGRFLMNPNAQLQFRYIINHRDEAAHTVGTPPTTHIDEDSDESGFEVRRMKFNLDGNIFAPNIVYKLQWATSRSTGGLNLEEAWVRIPVNRLLGGGDGMADFAVKLGQFKDFVFHEEITSSKRQLAVDRSMLNEALAGGITDYEQGASLIWDDGPEGRPLRTELAYVDGANSDNTNFVDGGGSSFYDVANPDYGVAGRIEYLAFGNWKAYEDFSALANTEDTLAFGAGFHFNEAGNAQTLLHTVDAQYEMGRWGFYGAYVGAATDNDNSSGGNWYDWGFLAQAGYMLTDKWELFGRYDWVSLDEDRTDDETDFSEITAGVNYYYEKHALKLTADVTYLPDGTPLTGTTADGIGHLADDEDEDQIIFRAQLQLLL